MMNINTKMSANNLRFEALSERNLEKVYQMCEDYVLFTSQSLITFKNATIYSKYFNPEFSIVVLDSINNIIAFFMVVFRKPYLLKKLRNIATLKFFVVNEKWRNKGIGSQIYNEIIARIKNSKYKDKTELFVEPVSKHDNCLGILETIKIVADNYKFKEPVLVLAPDNVFTENQDSLIHNFNGNTRIGTCFVSTLDDAKKFGVVSLNSGKIISCVEKPLNPESKTVRTSCEIWIPEVFGLLSEWNENFDSNKVGDFINHLIKKGITYHAAKLCSIRQPAVSNLIL